MCIKHKLGGYIGVKGFAKKNIIMISCQDEVFLSNGVMFFFVFLFSLCFSLLFLFFHCECVCVLSFFLHYFFLQLSAVRSYNWLAMFQTKIRLFDSYYVSSSSIQRYDYKGVQVSCYSHVQPWYSQVRANDELY